MLIQDLRNYLNTRLLGTDRLSGMEQTRFQSLMGDPFKGGIGKNNFHYIKQDGASGSGFDTIVILEERMDLRIRIEATLSQLFDREISFEWDSGNLVPMARRRGDSSSYRMDRDECHGIKELIVLLTHLYDSQKQCLIIDEPELNLHPQYQAFFIQEVRRIAGDPTTHPGKKIVFLITHSPFILDLRSKDDLESIISFDLQYSTPKQISHLGMNPSTTNSFVRRLNSHHKQLFFSDNPIFVEGIHDAWLVEAMMRARGVSAAGAGSCIIDAGGDEEVNWYLRLCQGLGKKAYFLYDLDSVFSGNLRSCMRDDETIQGFLASAGLGNDLTRYCGELDRELTTVVDLLLNSEMPPSLVGLRDFLNSLGPQQNWYRTHWAKARVAVMTAISQHQKDVISVITQQTVSGIEGRWKKILDALKEKNIHVLPGGTIERYLPCYSGDKYNLSSDAKRHAIDAEIEKLATLATEEDLASRYGDLYLAVCQLPSSDEVDVDAVLRNHLGRYIYDLQETAVNTPGCTIEQIRQRLFVLQPSSSSVFEILDFDHTTDRGFNATIGISEAIGGCKRLVHVNRQTNAATGDFQIEMAE